MSDINAILRDGSNVNMPALRAFLADLEGRLAQANLTIATGTVAALVGTRTYATRAALYADLAPADDLFALVYADTDPLKNGLYQKDGATGAGDWDGPFDLFSSAAEALVQDLVDDVAALSDLTQTALEALDSLEFVQQSIGFEGAMTGGALGTAGTFALTTPFAKSGDGIVFAMKSNGTGTVYAQIVEVDGSDLTVLREHAVSVVTGDNEVTIPNLPHAAGNFFGFRAVAGLLKIDAAPADYGYWASGSQIAADGTYTSAISDNVVFLVRCDSIKDYAKGANLAALEDLARKTDNPDYADFSIGRPAGSVLADGVPAGTSYYVFDKVAPIDMVLETLNIRGEVAGEIEISAWSGDTSSMTQARKRVITIKEGTQALPVRQLLRQGERWGVRALTGNFSIASMPSDPTPFYSLSSPSGTPSALNVGIRFEVVAEFVPHTALERIGNLEAAPYPNDTNALHLVWLLGESHVAGRALAFSSDIPTGRGHCYRRSSNSLAHLADPTGNDSIATTAPVRGSFGPSIGKYLLDRTGGAVGAVIVNSGEGGTTAGAEWASSGSAWTQAKADWDAVMPLVAGLPIAGVGIAILLGSNDAAAATTKAAFKAALIDLIERAQAYVDAGPDVPVALVMTGPFADNSNSTAVANMQAAQAEIVREVPNVFMATTALRFSITKGWYLDLVHVTQTANDQIGPAVGEVVLTKGAGLYPA